MTRVSSSYLAIVDRNRLDRFNYLQRHLADPGLVDVVWDRRRGERRQQSTPAHSERRVRERRGPPPASWALLDFAIVAPDTERAPLARRPRILVIDDDDRVRGVIGQMLERAGYEVVEARTGAVVQALSPENPLDLVVTDILMPEKDGVETIRELRQRVPAVRVIAMTGARGQFNRLRAATHVGADRILVKPFQMDDLLAAVREALSRNAHDDERRARA